MREGEKMEDRKVNEIERIISWAYNLHEYSLYPGWDCILTIKVSY